MMTEEDRLLEAQYERAICDEVADLIQQAAALLNEAGFQRYTDGYARKLNELAGITYQSQPAKKKPIPQSLRTAVFERDAYRCVECGDHRQLQCDHVHPESLGGEATMENLQTLCKHCNLSKGARIPT
jgi:5-methylcytosine-specific restriction endonuclease McrA